MSGRPYPPDWLDDGEAAYLLTLPVSTFHDYVSAGVLPNGVKIGKHRRWSRLSLNEALANMLKPAADSSIGEKLRSLGNGQAKGRKREAA
jgi:predicted DNA-binding transcriptional regulator AlpA